MAGGIRPNHKASILLIYNRQMPWFHFERYFYTRAPSIGLGYLASYLRDKGHQVRICDLQIATRSDLRRILKDTELDIVGITCLASSMLSTFELVKDIRERCKAVIVLGGSHATNWPTRLLNCGCADLVVLGEGERTLAEIADLTASGMRDFSSLTGVGYMVGDTPVVVPSSKTLTQLDDLPFPAFDLLDMARYSPGPNRAALGLSIPIITQRGCPFGCRYCDSETVFGRTVRFRSAMNIEAEIHYWKEKFTTISLMIWDDTFTFNREHCLEVCEVIQKQDLEWSCTTRPDHVDRDLLALMRKSGCTNIYFGAESFSLETLNKLHRTTTPESVEVAVASARQAGIRTSVGIVTGFPRQTVPEIYRDIQKLFGLGVEYPTINLYKPYGAKSLGYLEEAGVPYERAAECAFRGSAIYSGRECLLNILRLGFLTRYHAARAFRVLLDWVRGRIR